MNNRNTTLRKLRLLIREINSPLGDSEAELLSDMNEVLDVLTGIAEESDDPMVKIEITSMKNDLKASSGGADRAMSASIARILDFIEGNKSIEADGLILRLQTLLRKTLPASGVYDTPQSNLNPPFDPTKSGRYITMV